MNTKFLRKATDLFKHYLLPQEFGMAYFQTCTNCGVIWSKLALLNRGRERTFQSLHDIKYNTRVYQTLNYSSVSQQNWQRMSNFGEWEGAYTNTWKCETSSLNRPCFQNLARCETNLQSGERNSERISSLPILASSVFPCWTLGASPTHPDCLNWQAEVQTCSLLLGWILRRDRTSFSGRALACKSYRPKEYVQKSSCALFSDCWISWICVQNLEHPVSSWKLKARSNISPFSSTSFHTISVSSNFRKQVLTENTQTRFEALKPSETLENNENMQIALKYCQSHA